MKSIGLGAGILMGKVRHRVCGLWELMLGGQSDPGQVIRTTERIKAEGHTPELSSGRDGQSQWAGEGFCEEIMLQLIE